MEKKDVRWIHSTITNVIRHAEFKGTYRLAMLEDLTVCLKILDREKANMCEIQKPDNDKETLHIQNISASTFKKGDKVKVLIGVVWQNAEVERLHKSGDGYDCGTNDWSTYFPFCRIKPA